MYKNVLGKNVQTQMNMDTVIAVKVQINSDPF